MNNDVEELARLNKKKKFQLRRKHSNSKYGCLQCKKRRIKCGQELPQCKHCVSYRAKNLRCSYMNLSEAEKHLILEANRKYDDYSLDSNNNGHSFSNGNSPNNRLTYDQSSKILKPKLSSKSFSPPPEEPFRLSNSEVTRRSFRLYKMKISTDDKELLDQTFLFISKNLKMPIINLSYVKHIELVWNIWGNTTIMDGWQKTLANYYSLITWASSYLSRCIYDSIKINSKSQLGKKNSKSLKPLWNITLKNTGYSLQSLQAALDKKDYRLLLNLMSSNTFISSSNYGEDGYQSRMFHLNGLVAIIYELYLHGNQSTIYVPGTDGYELQDLSFLDKLAADRNNDTSVARAIKLRDQENVSDLLVPGYSYFNNFSTKESILIKFFEWQIYLATAAVFFPPYDHRCLFEFYDHLLDLKLMLASTCEKLLVNYADNLLSYLRYLFDEIFPQLENSKHQQPEGSLFPFSPKVCYKIYIKYCSILPPELIMGLTRGNHLSVIERLLYRYFINTGKILDHVFPQIKYLFIIGFSLAFIQYADELYIFNDLLYGDPDKCILTPKDKSNGGNYNHNDNSAHHPKGEPNKEVFADKLKCHTYYSLRVFGFFRARNLLLHNGILIKDPFNVKIKRNRLASRLLKLEETQIVSFDNTFIKPENYPHNAEESDDQRKHSPLLADLPDFDETEHGVTFKGFLLHDLAALDSNFSNNNILGVNKQHLLATPKQLLADPTVMKDQDGFLNSYDFVAGSLNIPVVIRNLVGQSLRDLYDDRSIIFNYFNGK